MPGYAQMLELAITTDASGDWTTTTSGAVRGTIRHIYADVDALDNTADLTITGATSGITILSNVNMAADELFSPLLAANQASDGAASADPALVPPTVAEPLTFTVAQGGNTLSGNLYVIYD